MNRRQLDGKAGFALVAVLWVSLLLAILALNYATTARINAEVARNRRLAAERDYLLASAVDKGYHEYLQYRANRGLLKNKEEVEELTGKPLELWYPRHEPWVCELGGVKIAVRLIEEAGKFNLNGLPVERWRQVLIACGVSEEEEQGIIIDSILDWIDGDSLHRLNGAEDDFYEAEDRDYGCKNLDFDVVDELLLVRGVSEALFAGGGGRPGLIDLLSPYGGRNQLDINCCDPVAFSLIEDLPPEVVQEIIALRSAAPIKSLADLSELVPFENFSQLQQLFTVTDSEYVTISAAEAGREDADWYRRTYKIGEKK